ncbi:hypothetical protein GH714_034397 [Hevea brasiliensis]|uniref:fructose-bisphosphate aldolase n=1 Tax=Hevea brasiliensis TaxID=3981 RepID=A0A6A6MK30_HEVBR|nr:hypothetical protein GH714_034397 [Hevea brasiliensis]
MPLVESAWPQLGQRTLRLTARRIEPCLLLPLALANVFLVLFFEETLYQSTTDGKKMVDVLVEQNIVPGIKVDKGLVPPVGSNDESWCQGLDGLASRSAAYYQ